MRLGSLALWALLSCPLFVSGAVFELEMSSGGDWKALENGQVAAELKDLTDRGSDALIHGDVTFRESESGGFQLASDGVTILTLRPLNVEARVPYGVSVEFSWGADPLMVQFTVADAMDQRLELKFVDGGKVTASGAASGRLEGFSNGAYLIEAGEGVRGVSADGVKVDFASDGALLTGGPLGRRTNAGGQETMERVTAVVEAEVSGEAGGIVTVELGGQRVELRKGEERLAELESGAQVWLAHDADGKFKWEARKGIFEFTVNGITGWKATGYGGQTASMAWDIQDRVVDIQNLGSKPFAVQLGPSSAAIISPGALFQYGDLGMNRFATSANYGQVTFQSRGSEAIDLTTDNLVFRGGQVEGAPRSAAALSEFALNWQAGAMAQIQGSAGLSSLGFLETQEMDLLNGGKVRLQYLESGSIKAEAIRGTARVRLPGINQGMWVDVEQGNAIELKLGAGANQIKVMADGSNRGYARLWAGENFSSLVVPGQEWDVLYRPDKSFQASSAGIIQAFHGPEEEIPPLSGKLAGAAETEVDAARILRQAASVFR